MKILISGTSGLVGTALVKSLRSAGDEVVCLVRKETSGSDCLVWNPSSGRINPTDCEGFDVIIHLGGENIANGRWTAKRKQQIRDSRVVSTQLLADTIRQLKKPPGVFACASAVGLYGNRGNELLTEISHAGTGFLAEVVRDWEAAANASSSVTRVIDLRFGVILTPTGGALAKMLPAFRFGLGGKVGDGKQYWSWISLPDVVSAIEFTVRTKSLVGPVNIVSPQPLTNLEFTNALGHVLNRPTIIPLPAFAARLLLGEMADAALLASTRVEPVKLKAAGYQFRHPELAKALRELL